MKNWIAILFLIFCLNLYADDLDPLCIDENKDLKFTAKEQISWTAKAIDEYQNLKTNTSLKTKKKLSLVISSDLNDDGLIDDEELRLIRGRLASICVYYEKFFESYLVDPEQRETNMRRLKYKFPEMIPGYDLIDPFIEKVKIKKDLSPIYF